MEILLALNDEKSNNDSYSYFSVYKKCREFAETIKENCGLVLPTDFLRIDNAISQRDTAFFDDITFVQNNEPMIKHISQPLTTLYFDSIHKLLNIAIISDITNDYDIALGAWEVLFSTFVNQPEKYPYIPIYLSKRKLLGENNNLPSDSNIVESRIIDTLSYFSAEFDYMALLSTRLTEEIYLLDKQLSELLPKISSKDLTALLSSRLCFRYGDFIKELDITYKTAVEYLKQLEAKGFVASSRVGREKVFINTHLFSLAQEVELDGP